MRDHPTTPNTTLRVEHQRWKVEMFDKMRDALWQITTAKTLQEAHDLARKALNE